MATNGNNEVLEAISTLSSHVDTEIKGVRDHVDVQVKGVKEEIGKLRSNLIDHVTRTVNNATFTTRDPRVSKVVLKLRDKNVFDMQDVQEILAPPVAA